MRTIRMSKAEFDSSKKIVETDTEIIVPTIFTREAILPFPELNGKKGYRSAKELKDAAWTLENAWIVPLAHIPTVFVTNRADIWGKVKNVRFCDQINGILGDSHFSKAKCDKAFLELVKKGDLKNVSPAYFCEEDFLPGEFAGEKFDFAQTEFMFGHVAVGIQEGRCPSPFCGMTVDSLFAKPHGDPEVMEKYVRIRVRDPGLFVEGKFRTIVLSADEGIHAVIGKLKSDPEGGTVIQNYMFELAKDWTMEKAQAWVKKHKDQMDAAGEVSEKELREKIGALEEDRQKIIDKLYPRPPEIPEVERRKLQLELSLLESQVHAFTEVLAEKLTGVEIDGKGEAKPAEAKKADSIDPEETLARSRELLRSR